MPDGPLHPALGAEALIAALAMWLIARRKAIDPMAGLVAAVAAVSWATGRGAWVLVVAAVVAAGEAVARRELGKSIGLLSELVTALVVAASAGIGWQDAPKHADRLTAIVVVAGVAACVIYLDRVLPALAVVALCAGWMWATVPDTEGPLVVGVVAVTLFAGQLFGDRSAQAVIHPVGAMGAGAAVAWALASGTAGRAAVTPHVLIGLFTVLAVAMVPFAELVPARRPPSRRRAHQP